MELEIEVDAIAGVLVVGVTGEVVRDTADKLRECLERAMTGGRPIVVDLLGVVAMDESGVQLLLDVHAKLATRLRVVVARGGPVHARLKDAGIAHVLALHPSRATAMAAS